MIDSCGISTLELQMTSGVQIDFFASDFQGGGCPGFLVLVVS